MASRTPKTGAGGSVEFAAGTQPWQITELDSDFDAIFANIDNFNIKTGANIATAKLAIDAGIVTGMLAPLAVTTAKIAVGATVVDKQSAMASLGLTIPTGSPGAETPVCILPALTTRAAPVLISGTIGWGYGETPGGNATFTVRLYRDSTQILIATVSVASLNDTLTGAFPSVNWIDFAPGAGSHIYKLTAQVNGTGTFSTNATNPGSMAAVALA